MPVPSQDHCDPPILRSQETQPFIHNIQGTGKDRRIMLISLSETMKRLEMQNMAVTVGGFRYCADFYRKLLESGLYKISGTAQKDIFHTIETMMAEALRSETYLISARELIRSAILALETGRLNRIGSARLWKKHSDTMINLLCQVDSHQIKQREEDGKPELLDLPKECIYNILYRLCNPKDILNMSQTCSYLNTLCMDSLLWQNMCFLHFSEKQVASLIDEEIDYCDTDWMQVFYLCRGKYRLVIKEVYGDEIKQCNNCRKIYWRLLGHPCSNPDMPRSSSEVTPAELVCMLRL